MRKRILLLAVVAALALSAIGCAWPPVAVISFTPGNPTVGTKIYLNAYNSSYNITPEAAVDLTWTIVSQPVASIAALNTTDGPETWFIADKAGDYDVRLDIVDPAWGADQAGLVITVNP